jgi:hypothetical protein
MKSLVTVLVLFALFCVLSIDCAKAQQVSTAPERAGTITSAPSRFEIQRNFLTIERSNLTRQFRQLERCIRNARQNLVDVQGIVNRVAQTDLINCGRRLEILLRKQRKLTRLSTRLEAEAEIEFEILSQLLRQASSTLNAPSSQSRTPGFLPP